MSKTAWIIFSAIIIGTLALLIFFSESSKLDIDSIDINAIQIANEQNGNIGDHIYGKVGSKVTLIEYADFQCAPCGSMYPITKNITELYKDQIQFIFRNFPITTSHPNAKAAAGAAEAAGLQGKYWEMHDKIYTGQDDWSNLSITERTDFFTNYARAIGLDVDRFNSDLTNAANSINKKINYDYSLGQKAKVKGTPSFYLNGKPLSPDMYSDKTKFKEVINNELSQAGIELPDLTD